jgi:hypothetical protein
MSHPLAMLALVAYVATNMDLITNCLKRWKKVC